MYGLKKIVSTYHNLPPPPPNKTVCATPGPTADKPNQTKQNNDLLHYRHQAELMSIAFIAPSIPRRGSLNITANNTNDLKSLHQSHTFACCPPATGINRSNTSNSITTPNKPLVSSRAPTFGPSGQQLKRPRRTRTGIVHFEPQPAKNGLIISGYTCIGKTSFRRRISLRKTHVLNVIDLDSSAYSKDPDFVEKYLAAIRSSANERSIVLISTHEQVAARLKEEGYYVALVYPEGSSDNKQEWLRRLEEREVGGKDSYLYKLVNDNWEIWDKHLQDRPVSKKVALSHNDYLISVFKDIYKDYFQQVIIH